MRHRRPLRTVLAWAIVVAVTVVLSVAAVVLGAVPTLRRYTFSILRTWARLCLWAADCPLQVEGQLPRLEEGPFVVMANHQSALDIPVVLAAVPSSWRLAIWGKRSLFAIPFLGWSMRAAGMVPIDRSRRSTAPQVFHISLRLLRSGRCVLVFPEETYGPGDELLPLQRGGFLVAAKARVKVVPLSIRGTRRALAPGHWWLAPQPVSAQFHQPLSATDGRLTSVAGLVEGTRRALDPRA